MAKFGIPKEQLQGLPPIPPGIYEFRLDGYEPKFSRPKPGKDPSINLNPKAVIINNPNGLNDRRLPEAMNVQAGWVRRDFVHALGLRMDNEGTDDASEPGEFQGDPTTPESLVYIGPLLQRVGKVEIAMVDNGRGGTRAAVKRYFCAVQGCTERHDDNYLRS